MVLYGMVSDKYKLERATGIGLGLWSNLQTFITARENRDASIIWDDQDQWEIRSWRFYALPAIYGRIVRNRHSCCQVFISAGVLFLLLEYSVPAVSSSLLLLASIIAVKQIVMICCSQSPKKKSRQQIIDTKHEDLVKAIKSLFEPTKWDMQDEHNQEKRDKIATLHEDIKMWHTVRRDSITTMSKCSRDDVRIFYDDVEVADSKKPKEDSMG
nr:hypothetical protein [Tanacetum cinerariifolium]